MEHFGLRKEIDNQCAAEEELHPGASHGVTCFVCLLRGSMQRCCTNIIQEIATGKKEIFPKIICHTHAH